jgi:uncharacterized membrane protein YhdT
MKQDQRNRQSDREALLALAVYALYFAWWYVFGYCMGGGSPEDYDYIFGFPAWFFYSCLVGYPLITLLLWVMVRFFFKDIPLEADLDEEDGEGRP